MEDFKAIKTVYSEDDDDELSGGFVVAAYENYVVKIPFDHKESIECNHHEVAHALMRVAHLEVEGWVCAWFKPNYIAYWIKVH
jgi:hypothetical protein